jgi:cleavage and polyadenylation specificity factor subunit 1
MVLQTGQEINELDSSGFATTQTTVFAGNLGGGSFSENLTKEKPESS